MMVQNTETLNQIMKAHSGIYSHARWNALSRALSSENLIPPVVTFESRGYTLLVGDDDELLLFASLIPPSVRGSVVCLSLTPFLKEKKSLSNIMIYYAFEVEIKGFLGAFDVDVIFDNQKQNLSQIAFGRPQFDLIIDLTKTGIHKAQVLPLGYYAVGRAVVTKEETLSALEEMKGTFDKPKYFHLDKARCAHTSRSVKGCTRCIDACDADALNILDMAININPYLCQGQGACATACPTEAIRYALPESVHIQGYIFQILQYFKENNGESPTVLFYSKADEMVLAEEIGSLKSNVFPVQLEELASVGIDTWFCTLIYGAANIILLDSDSVHEKTRRVIERELQIAHDFLLTLNMPSRTISLLSVESLNKDEAPLKVSICHDLQLQGSKREKLAQALDLLAEKSKISTELMTVRPEAPYGQIHINVKQCTLCVSCVAVCPTDALQTLGTHPGISFREQDCVQCGLCQRACPESVISLIPRYNWDPKTRKARITLNEEEAEACLSCGKAFAPVSLVNMLKEKLREHSHFQNDAILRLSMCEDCRVRNIVSEIMHSPEKQIKL